VPDDGADHGGIDIQADDAFVGEVDFPGFPFDLPIPFLGYFHPQFHHFLLAIFFDGDDMVIGGIPFDRDGGAIKLFCPQFLYLFYLVFEVFILILAEHIFDLVAKVLFPVLHLDLKGIAVEGVGIGVHQFVCLQHAVLCLLVCLYHPSVLCHLADVYRNGLVVDQLFSYLRQCTLLGAESQKVVVVGQQRVGTHEVLAVAAQHYHPLRVVLLHHALRHQLVPLKELKLHTRTHK
jgi:hypothetical protein